MEDALQKEEQSRLQMILSLLQKRLYEAEAKSGQLFEGLKDTRRDEFQERIEPLLKNLWASDSFEDLVHLSQEFQNAAEEEKDHEETLRRIRSLKKALRSPYFARIDLSFDDEDEDDTEKVYIGRHSVWDDEKENLLVYDWRAPMASVFYRFGVGPAFYQAPAGKINCRMLLKRQFEIQKGELIGFFDADTVIQDSFLRRLLAQNASAQMKAIVETIQRDQDTAIRDEDHDLLMVQGAAGSGKTSIAMHRVAYLMYEGLKSPLKAHNILILSPNTVFEKYISGVLPELGESSVATTTMEQLLEDIISCPVQSRADRWEELCAQAPQEAAGRAEAVARKTSLSFLAQLDDLARRVPDQLPFRDLSYGGKVFAAREEIRQTAMEHSSKFPLAVRLSRLEQALWQRVHAMRPARLDELRMLAFRAGRGEEFARGYSIWESGVLARAMHAMTRLDYRQIYLDFLRASDAPLPRDGDALPLEDAAAIAYLRLKMSFGESRGDIRQVVVDEAQDYSPVDYAVLNLLFPKARFTVVGDTHQCLDRPYSPGLYDEIGKIVPRRSPALLELNKSFRCTREILEFSRQFLPGQQIRSLNRSGDRPQILPEEALENEIAACRAKGYESIALITKTRRDAENWQARLNVPLMGRSAQMGDVFLVPLPLSKGLEFDCVLILDCDAAHYKGDQDAYLLYVACTRALHRLALFAKGGFTPLLLREEENRA